MSSLTYGDCEIVYVGHLVSRRDTFYDLYFREVGVWRTSEPESDHVRDSIDGLFDPDPDPYLCLYATDSSSVHARGHLHVGDSFVKSKTSSSIPDVGDACFASARRLSHLRRHCHSSLNYLKCCLKLNLIVFFA